MSTSAEHFAHLFIVMLNKQVKVLKNESKSEVITKQEPEIPEPTVSSTQPQVEDTTNKTSDNIDNNDNDNNDNDNNNDDIKDNKDEVKDDNNDKSNEPIAMEIDTNEPLLEVKQEEPEDVVMQQ